MQEWILQLISSHEYLVYAILVLICFIEGPILTIVCGILLKLGAFPLIPLYLALMLGDLIGDVVWYWIGRRFGHPFVRRYGKYFSIEESEISIVTEVFHKYHSTILIISKVTMGLGFAVVTLFTAGLVRIPFRKYFAINAAGQIIWTGLLLFIGFTFGQLFSVIEGALGKISIIAVAVMVVFIFIGFGRYVKKRLTAANKAAASATTV